LSASASSSVTAFLISTGIEISSAFSVKVILLVPLQKYFDNLHFSGDVVFEFPPFLA
jgi:hypothetical protein